MSDHSTPSNSSATTAPAPRTLTAAYGYNPAQEIDSCGVGLVVALDGKRRRDVVVAGIDALKAVWHRGAVDADGKTGDGAGIHVEIPQDFFRDHVRNSSGETPQVGRIAVGMVFLPRTDLLRAGALPHHRRDRDPALRPHHPGLAPGAGRHLGDRREGQRHAARDRADPDRPRRRQARQPRVREAALHPAPAHGEGGAGRQRPRILRLLAQLPLGRLQGHVPGRASLGLLSRPSGRALHLAVCDLPPALLDQHLPAMEAGPAVPRAGAQRRDQHASGQRQLDEEPRGAARA